MKLKSTFRIATLSLTFAILSAGALHAEPVITEDVLRRYMAIYPSYWRITMELDSTSKMAAGEAKDNKVTELIEKRNSLLTANDWEDFLQFQEVDMRILRAIIPLDVLQKFKDAPESDRKQVETTTAEKLKDYTAEEVALLKKNLVQITKMRQRALSGQ